MEKEKEFSFKGFWGSELLRPFVEHSKNGMHYCVYCGSIADTREHVPSKVFLNKPLPNDLPTLPACQKCNNGFSSDELYVNTFIECIKRLSESGDIHSTEILQSVRKEVIEAKEAAKSTFDRGFFIQDERIRRIIYKLAIGHIVYELFECYNLKEFPVAKTLISYIFRCSVDEESWEHLETIEPISNEVLPEVGSRVFRNLYVLDLKLTGLDNRNITIPQVFMDWTDIQDGVYRYIAYYNNDEIIVKMIIRDYLFAEVHIIRNE